MDVAGLALDDYGDPTTTGADGTSYTTADIAEAEKMAPYVANDGSGQPWWQSVVKYGLTKAIDNTMPGRANGIQGNTNPGTFAGQNGRTYGQPGSLNKGPVGVSSGVNTNRQASMGGMSPAMLLGLGVVALLVLPKLLK
jgi:hypothetical protein